MSFSNWLLFFKRPLVFRLYLYIYFIFKMFLLQQFIKSLFLLFLTLSEFSLSCPNACRCSENQDVQNIESSDTGTQLFVSCEKSELSEIPEIPANTEHLMFSGNNLTYLDELSLRGRQYLQTLDLSYNSIISMGKQTFAGLKNLVKVDLSWNQLSFIHSEVFSGLKSRQLTVDLSGNPLHCNCRFKKSWDQILSHPEISVTGGVCASPKHYRGDGISTLDKICDDEINGHDITLIILACLTVTVATILNFWSHLKRLFGSCRIHLCSRRDFDSSCPDGIKNILKPSSRKEEYPQKDERGCQDATPKLRDPRVIIQKSGPYAIDESPSSGDSASSALNYFSNRGGPSFRPDSRSVHNSGSRTIGSPAIPRTSGAFRTARVSNKFKYESGTPNLSMSTNLLKETEI